MILDATHEGPKCLQYEFYEQKIAGTEDCLTLNVYTQDVRKPIDILLVLLELISISYLLLMDHDRLWYGFTEEDFSPEVATEKRISMGHTIWWIKISFL